MNQLKTLVVAESTRDRAQAHELRLSLLEQAIIVALLGNATQVTDAAAAAAGKTQLARAWRAGFAALPATIARLPYTGKATDAVRAEAAKQAAPMVTAFDSAFLQVAPLAPAEKTEEEKAAAKVKREATARKAAEDLARSLGWQQPGVDVATLTPAALVDHVVACIGDGRITGENLIALAQAVKAATKPAEPAKPASKARRVKADATPIHVPKQPAENAGARAADAALGGVPQTAMGAAMAAAMGA